MFVRGTTVFHAMVLSPRETPTWMFRLWIFLKSVGLGNPDGQCPSPVVGAVDLPAVGRVETIQLFSPPMSGQLSPGSPRTVAFEDSSVPLSPNHVQAGRSQEVPEDGSLFNVSPVSPGYMPGQSSVQPVLTSRASSHLDRWSSTTAQIADIAREGPFDAFASPMDTEDSPLVTTDCRAVYIGLRRITGR